MRELTPSETVYFHAEDFAREKKLLDAVALLHTDRKVDASELVEAILAAAFIHAEDAGAIRIAPGKAGRLFGLRKVDVAEISVGTKGDAFPAGTIEARLRELVAGGPREAERVVHELLGEDSTYPDMLVLTAVQRGLLASKLLETEETRRVKVFKVETLKLPDATRALAAATPAAPVKERLARWQKERAVEWSVLQKGIRAGIAGRKEASDGPD